MANTTIKLEITFEALVKAIAGFDIDDKLRLLDILDEQIAQYQENHPKFREDVEQANAEYEAGNFLTLDDYMAQEND
jgi:hypothetical protein